MDGGEDTFLRFHKALASFSADTLNILPSSTVKDTTEEDKDKSEEQNLFAHTLPVERFLGIPGNIRRRYFFESALVGDIIRGRVENKWAQGLSVKIESLEYGKNRWIKDLNLKAHCNTHENKQAGRRLSDTYSDFEIGDKVRAVICSVNANDQQVTISFQQEKLPFHLKRVKLGIIEDRSNNDSDDFEEGQSYLDCLRRSPVFSNPGCVQNLISSLRISTKGPCSFLRNRQSSQVLPEESAEILREKQSSKWSMEMTAVGIKQFKGGKSEEALKYLDQALQLYPTNVEALVARGALKANKTNLKDAITDFRQALSIKPSHRNGQNYLAETLIALARQYEKDKQWKDASRCYKDASRCYKDVLEIFPDHEESNSRLQQIQLFLAQQVLVGEKRSTSSVGKTPAVTTTKSTSSVSSVSKLKYFLEEKTRHKKSKKNKKPKKKQKRKKRDKKRRRSKASSTSSSSDSSDSGATESATEEQGGDSDEWVEKEGIVSASKCKESGKKESRSYPSKTEFHKQSSNEKDSSKRTHGSVNNRDSESHEGESNKRTLYRSLADHAASPKRQLHKVAHAEERNSPSPERSPKKRRLNRSPLERMVSPKRHTHKHESRKEVKRSDIYTKEKDFRSSKKRSSDRSSRERASRKMTSPKRETPERGSPKRRHVEDSKRYGRKSSKEYSDKTSTVLRDDRHDDVKHREKYSKVTDRTTETNQRSTETVPLNTKKLKHFSETEMSLVAQILGNKDAGPS